VAGIHWYAWGTDEKAFMLRYLFCRVVLAVCGLKIFRVGYIKFINNSRIFLYWYLYEVILFVTINIPSKAVVSNAFVSLRNVLHAKINSQSEYFLGESQILCSSSRGKVSRCYWRYRTNIY
jgi:hypothetical protein